MRKLEYLYLASQVAGAVTTLMSVCCLLIRPIRERVLGLADIREGMKCQLRSDMLRTYYRHGDSGTIRQYEYENFLTAYKAYKALGGNSFMDKIYREVQTWQILT